MSKRPRLFHSKSILLLGLLLAACTGGAAELNPDARFGIPVDDAFLSFYDEMGGRAVLGEPITIAFPGPGDGRLLQYFDNLRLEQDLAGSIVAASPLGERLMPPTVSKIAPENGDQIAAAFEAFYQAHQGETLLGPSISEIFLEDERAVQYFRNGRLDWYPNLPEGNRVLLGPLGRADYFDSGMVFYYADVQENKVVPAVNVTAVDVFASVRSPILYGGEQQTLYVKVVNLDSGETVSDLRIEATLSYDGVEQVVDLGVMGSENRVHTSLDVSDAKPGDWVQVNVAVYAPGDRLVGTNMLTFQTWW